jgi:ergothioneine biosynthesis protein EgtB
MLSAQADVGVRHSLLARLSDARRRSDDLFDVVRPASIYERPIPERHRIIFYIGHLEAFDWNLLHEHVFGLESFHTEFDRLFAFGIDPVGGGLPTDRSSDWPSMDAVRGYVKEIRAALDQRLDQGMLGWSAKTRDGFPPETLLNVAIEHRLMHAETLAYMLHQLPLDRKIRQTDPLSLVTPPVNHRIIEIPSGTATLGLPPGSFGWDNEFDAHTTQLPAFEIDEYMVTNRQYLEFMTAGGYETRAFWSDEDWDWKTAHAVSHPVFWRRTSNGWLYRTMFEETALPLDWPVYLSHAEANAYARSVGKSLPTEAEWHRAAFGSLNGEERHYPWGHETPDSRFGNFDFGSWNPTPVNASPQGQSAFGVQGMLGNGWEWTSSMFAPFSGFQPFPFYRGYSTDFFDGRHFVMKGGSARTAASMLRPSFRNWFQAHYQYAYAGLRCVSR